MRRVHGPVAVDACDQCHRAVGAAEAHRFTAARPPETLCSTCHPPVTDRPSVHVPYRDSDCMSCHDPHGGENPSYLLEPRVDRVCATCHPPLEGKHPHAPVSTGDCLGCHAGHHSRHEHLLRFDEALLCSGCHEGFVPSSPDAVSRHAPLESGCGDCHLAHGGDHPALLRASRRESCAPCHGSVYEAIAAARSAHRLEASDAWCLECHAPHESQAEKLTRKAMPALCQDCHAEDLERPGGGTVPGLDAEMDGAVSIHAPVGDGDCASCHDPHGADRAAMLRQPYATSFYQPFREEAYELCFSCHDRRSITEPTTTLTGFRSGDRNLHRLHVVGDKGRSCGACHSPHASGQPRLVRETVSFGPGGWLLPIEFEATQDGGSCRTGCHESYTYRRSGESPRAGDGRSATTGSDPGPR